MRASDIIFAPPSGGELLLIQDGEVLASLFVPPGRNRASFWLDLVEPGQSLEPGKTLTIFPARDRLRVIYSQGHFDSAANPVFRPNSADRMARELEARLNRADVMVKRLAARERAMERAAAVPEAVAALPVKPGKEGAAVDAAAAE